MTRFSSTLSRFTFNPSSSYLSSICLWFLVPSSLTHSSYSFFAIFFFIFIFGENLRCTYRESWYAGSVCTLTTSAPSLFSSISFFLTLAFSFLQLSAIERSLELPLFLFSYTATISYHLPLIIISYIGLVEWVVNDNVLPEKL